MRPFRLALAGLVLAGATPAAALAADPLSRHQWGLRAGHGVDARAGWAQTRGAGVVVAILDSGVQLDHPDLAANLWTNPAEIPGNAIDDDRDGYVDDVHGANVIGQSGVPYDDNGHGTHVAGIVAASAANGIGGSGVAPEARIMAVKVLDARRAGDSSTLARGIRYAVAHRADIINASVNGNGSSAELEAAIDDAGRAGITVVTSAGNDARDIDLRPSFPASLPALNLVTVTATQPDGTYDWTGGNYGRRSVDLAAPGVSILSTTRGSGWGRMSGTSMAAPFASGALALLTAARRELGPARLRASLLAGARRTRDLRRIVGAGRLSVPGALRRALSGPSYSAAAARRRGR